MTQQNQVVTLKKSPKQYAGFVMKHNAVCTSASFALVPALCHNNLFYPTRAIPRRRIVVFVFCMTLTASLFVWRNGSCVTVFAQDYFIDHPLVPPISTLRATFPAGASRPLRRRLLGYCCGNS